ncbi:hypothetical protein MTsPCn5_15030 [Croceitalea sp. MTPC5]|uniref:DinB family protein n=1 Tax=Croceitalea sp. MTPC5 TaxID=3056565 RepID=UPI002B3790C2|nr:hypothetical protein MTsPCn5_15030 [Croceitalea sp. MTPC5]
MFETSYNTLIQLKTVLANLPENCFAKPCEALSGSSIGQHTRHVIELYQCLLKGYDKAVIDYDDRARDIEIETDVHKAIDALNAIQEALERPDKNLLLVNRLNGESVEVQSTYFREVLYNLEHVIHHKALLKVGIQDLDQPFSLPSSFGIAPATIEFRKKCVQ